jgi:Yip1 domain.
VNSDNLNNVSGPAASPAQPSPAAPHAAHTGHTATNKKSFDLLGSLKYLWSSLAKPFQTFKDNSSETDKPKVAFLLAGIVTVIMTTLQVITLILASILKKDNKKVEIVWDSLKRAEFLPVVFKSLLLFFGLILAIAIIFYMANLVAKRQVTFGRFLSLATIAAMPYLLGQILTAIVTVLVTVHTDFSKLKGDAPFGMYVASAIAVIGLVYSIVIAVTLINNEMSFDDKNIALYFSAATLAIVMVSANIVIPKVEKSIAESMTSKSMTVKVDGEKYDCDDIDIDSSDFDSYTEYRDTLSEIREKCSK